MEGGADWGYGDKGKQRKVLLWSRWPLDGIDRVGAANLPPGRFVAATSRTPLGLLRLVGVCVPWARAHVGGGRRDRAPWEDHLTYLEHLGPLVRSGSETRATIVLGDFNQRIPRTRQPIRIHEALHDALAGFVVATEGIVPGVDRPLIDHIVHSPSLRASDVNAIDRQDGDGKPLSDHDSVRARLHTTAPGDVVTSGQSDPR